MNIRIEQPQDYREVENLTREAFWNVYRTGCTEHYVLNQYRNNPDFIPELDFVMEEDGEYQSSDGEYQSSNGSLLFRYQSNNQSLSASNCWGRH